MTCFLPPLRLFTTSLMACALLLLALSACDDSSGEVAAPAEGGSETAGPEGSAAGGADSAVAEDDVGIAPGPINEDSGTSDGMSGTESDTGPDETADTGACVDDASCADGHDCTVDTCDPGVGCLHEAVDAVCDDGVDCSADVCDPVLGCVVTPEDVACDDDNPCTSDSCDPNTGCVNSSGALDCDDGVDCTVDSCDSELGCVVSPDHAVCDDGEPCTEDLCDEDLGCSNAPSTGACDDGDACTGNDSCETGECRGDAIAECYYAEAPDLANCEPGTLSSVWKLQALDDVNYIRALSGLPPVIYHWEGDLQTQASSLAMVANSQLSHTPPPSWACWSQAGADGAESSNLYIQWQWEPEHHEPWASMLGWLIDEGVPSLGHRRWMLDPFLSQVSYGAVHGPAQVSGANYPQSFASSLQVIHEEQADLAGTDVAWVAYPVGDYPSELVDKDWYLSFSWLVDPLERYMNSLVDVSAVQILVTGADGVALSVTDLSTNNDWAGLPNHIQWRVSGLVEGKEYTVTISGGVYGDTALSSTYTFKLL